MVPIKIDYIEKGRENRPGYPLTPKYITIHDTADPDEGARQRADYAKSNSAALRDVSWHFVVDDKEIYQSLPLTENAWHAGDGRTGTGNRQSIAVEICENSDGDRARAEDNAAKLVAKLMREFDIPLVRVVQHNYWNEKFNCPHVLLERVNGWEEFLAMVKFYYDKSEIVEQGFDDVLKALKMGYAVQRQKWPETMELKLIKPTGGYITEPYFTYRTGEKTNNTKIWYPTSEDLLANDWIICW